MQKHLRHILGKKNQITLVSGILIALAFISKWMTASTDIFMWSLIIASILGGVPIAIQIPIFTSKGSKYRCPSNYCSYRSICHKEL